MEEKTEKKFTQGYDELMADAMPYFINYKNHRKLFETALPKEFPVEFQAVTLETIENAQQMSRDEEMQSARSSETILFDQKIEELLKLAVPFVYKAELHFGAGAPEMRALKLSNHLKDKTGRSAQLTAIGTFAKAVREHAEMFKSEGLLEPQIVAIETKAKEITDQQWSRMQSQVNRNNVTKQRIKAFNTVWETMVHIHKGSRVVCYDKPDLLELFELPKRKQNSHPIEPDAPN